MITFVGFMIVNAKTLIFYHQMYKG